MPRPRKPTQLLLLNGAGKRNPGRLEARANEPEPQEGLGDPPEYFDAEQKERWAELVAIVPSGVLTRMDRPSAEQLCRLWAKMRRNEISVAQERLLASLWGKFGLTPSERSKVGSPGGAKKKPSNPFQKLG